MTMEGFLLLLVFLMPLAMTLLCLVLPRRLCEFATIGVAAATLGLVVAMIPATVAGVVTSPPFLRIDALSETFLMVVAFLYLATAVYSIGYFRDQRRAVSLAGPDSGPGPARYLRVFTTGLNAFAWSMIAAPAVNGLALLWAAIEVTTVISALLVALDRTDEATEAAWKYILIASSGLGIGLLATIVIYYAGSTVLGESYDLGLDAMIQVGPQLPAVPVALAFCLAVIGYGTKAGLFPVHTWLPDAHSEAPTPVSALLSGALLVVSFYAILRYYQIAAASLGSRFPRGMLIVFGLLSIAIAALSLFGQRSIKRLLAYSSIEHMGVLAVGVGLGTPGALAGVLLHVLAHGAAKGTAFMSAGSIVHHFGTKDMAGMGGAIRALPWTGPIFMLSVMALGGLPPFGIFRSEFMIVTGGVHGRSAMVTLILLLLICAAFLGLLTSSTRVVLGVPSGPQPESQGDEESVTEPAESSYWMVAACLLGLAGLLVLGIHPPQTLQLLIAHGAAEIGGHR